MAIHTGVAAFTSTPEINLTPPEAKALALAAANVARHYPSFSKSQKTVDWGMFVSTLATVYGPRIYWLRRRQAEQRQHPGGLIVPTPQQPINPEAAAAAAPELQQAAVVDDELLARMAAGTA